MRSLLSRKGSVPNLFRLTDDAVIDDLTELLISGRLHVHMQPVRTDFGGGHASQQAAPRTGGIAEAPPPFPLSERRPSLPITAAEPVIEQPTFAFPIDSAAQAATLVAAAASGAAACYI